MVKIMALTLKYPIDKVKRNIQNSYYLITLFLLKKHPLRDVVQSFGKIRYLVFIQDRGEGGGPGVIFGKIKIQDSTFVYNILKFI